MLDGRLRVTEWLRTARLHSLNGLQIWRNAVQDIHAQMLLLLLRHKEHSDNEKTHPNSEL